MMSTSLLFFSVVVGALRPHPLRCPSSAAVPARAAVRAAASGYLRDPTDTAPVDVSEVERLLCERAEARAARNWNAADELRDQLGAMGVSVQDNEKAWIVSNDYVNRRVQQRHDRRDDRRYNDERRDDRRYNDERRIDLNDGKAYTKAEFRAEYGGFREWDMSPPEGSGRPERAPVAEQDDWRQRRRERDARRMSARSEAYTRAAECTAALDAATAAEIESLISRRLRKKLDKRYEEADALLSELEARGVSVSDDTRSWRADGLPFVYAYRCDGGSAGRSDDELQQVEELIRRRGVAKSYGRYEEADALADELFDLGVELDDKARKWWFVYAKRGAQPAGGGGGRRSRGHDYVRDARDDYDLHPEKLERIESLLGIRLAARKARDFERADMLQAELRGLGVEVDEKAKQWYVRYHDGGRAASSFKLSP
jgi:hypothetical protein